MCRFKEPSLWRQTIRSCFLWKNNSLQDSLIEITFHGLTSNQEYTKNKYIIEGNYCKNIMLEACNHKEKQFKNFIEKRIHFPGRNTCKGYDSYNGSRGDLGMWPLFTGRQVSPVQRAGLWHHGNARRRSEATSRNGWCQIFLQHW